MWSLQQLVSKAKARLRSGPCSGGAQHIIAFATKGNRICATGTNSYRKTHPAQAKYARIANQPKREYLHAEISALLRAPHDVDSLFVLRFNKQGEPVCAKPCAVCRTAIRIFNPNLKVFHT
jgi:deoxycytidylate deaminase